MKISKANKVKSYVLLSVIIFQTFYPTASMAIADSPSQPDFESYEDFNSTDMVNLITGDFAYNIPLLNVPSPEGGYQVPLSYHAGIETNEESTWVGLGWSLNPGGLTRNVSMYPDDFNGEISATTINGSGPSGYITSYPFYQNYSDGHKTTGGAVNLMGVVDFGWKDQKHFGIAPAGLTLKDGKVSYNSEYMQQGLTSLGTLALSSYGGAIGQAVNTAYSAVTTVKALSSQSSAMGTSKIGNWSRDLTVEKKGGLGGILGKKVHYKYYMNVNTQTDQYGTLYLGNMGTGYKNTGNKDSYLINSSSPGTLSSGTQANSVRSFTAPTGHDASSDMYLNYATSYGSYYTPTGLTYDLYNVKGAGVNGNISPYRLDVGSLCNKLQVGTDFQSVVGPAYLDPSVYKVPFKYAGDFSNSYNYSNLNNNISTMDDLFNVGSTTSSLLYVCNKNSKTYANYAAETGIGAYNTGYNTSNRTESNRTGLYNKKLVHARHVEWYSNAEISSGSAKTNGFIDTHQSISAPLYSRSSPTAGIGGFSITNEAGMTYHYAIPVYNVAEGLYMQESGSINYKNENINRYATMWLLTGITGADFVDRNSNGIIDDTDWGYWVKFDYGLFSSDYVWRAPYYHTVKNGSFDSYKKGKKETYYLNKISTRTHTALFVKSKKLDGKSFYESDVTSPFNNEPTSGALVPNAKPSSSLKLNDVYVLENSDYAKLIASTGSGGIGLTLTNTSGQNSSIFNNDTYDNVLDSLDIVNASAQTFLESNQIERIHFNYDYKLCKYTYNSFDFDGSGNPPTYDPMTTPTVTNHKGKLTLRSVEFYSKNNSKLLPGYEFKYGDESDPNYNQDDNDNPNYHPHKWDGYGIFKSGGTGREDVAHNAEKKGDQWCLTDIITPTGGTISVEYERDDYTSINGYPCTSSSLKFFRANSTNLTGTSSVQLHADNFGSTTSLSDLVSVNDVVRYTYGASVGLSTISSISGNVLNLSSNFAGNPTYIGVKTQKKYGSSVRVKSITTKDENSNEYKTKYVYTKNGQENGTSSGVAAYESDFDRNDDGSFPFYNLFEHPYSPVLYSNVTVVNGRNDATFKETSKQSFHFVTPHKEMIKHEESTKVFGSASGQYRTFKTTDNTASIGNLDTIKVYNQFNNVVNKTVFEYTDNSKGDYPDFLGHYSETSVLWETDFVSGSHPTYTGFYTKLTQSNKLKRPNILKSVTTYKDRLVSKQEIKSYDYQTGQPLVTLSTYGGQEKYESATVYAYNTYTAMGSKVYSPASKNLMAAVSENYSYVYDKNNQKKLLGASVMTWSNSNTFREYNSGSGLYANQTYTTNWLPAETYNYKTKISEDGTISNSDYAAFNWSGAIDPRWIKTSKASLYDHYSHSLEGYDINNNPSSVKYGYNNAYVVSSCPNALYRTWCFSGAEDSSPDANYYEGEVKGSNYKFASSTYAHTGGYCSKIATGQSGFSYRIKKSDLPSIGKYRASVWVHMNGVQGAYLDCKGYNASGGYIYNGGVSSFALLNSTSSFAATVEKAGNWYLLNIDVDLSQINTSVDYLVFSVENNPSAGYAAYVYADDFRVCPLNNPIEANVFEAKTGKVIASLDKENYATKFFYDDAGKLTSVYKETKLGFTKVSETKYQYSK
jgi:hypothetical protein